MEKILASHCHVGICVLVFVNERVESPSICEVKLQQGQDLVMKRKFEFVSAKHLLW